MLLSGKVAVVYGAGGPIGGAIARGFVAEGARVFLAGRTREPLAKLAGELGNAAAEVVDAQDEAAVHAFTDAVVERTGRLDISVNTISAADVQRPLLDLSVAEFMSPIDTLLRAHYLTTRAAARHMIRAGSGVILAFGGSGPHTSPGLGGFKIALDAVEGLRRQWSAELGQHGIRVVTIKTGGIPETLPADLPERGQITTMIEGSTLLGRAATLADVGNVAAFVASDQAGPMTAATVNISSGTLMDY